MLSKIFLLYLLVIIAINDASGYIVSGKVTTTANKFVKYAQIKFVSQVDTNIYFTTVTDTFGAYAISLTTGVTEIKTNTESFQLHQNYPNPFSEKTTISYSISEKSNVIVTIYDILGRKVTSFQQDYTQGSTYAVEWDGKNSEGIHVAYGIYFYRVMSSQGTQTKKMVYINPSDLRQVSLNKSILNKTGSSYKNTAVETYKVYIDNKESTQPVIEPCIEENITVTKDTVLNFKVLDATPGVWHYLGLGNETVRSIAVHPNNPDIIYVGTSFDFSAGHMGKLFKSTNGGRSWDTLMVGQPLFNFNDIVIDPIHPETMYTIPLPVLKSTNGGSTWFDISKGIRIDWETRVSSIALDPDNSNILYAGTGGFYGGRFYKSADGGENWRDIARGDTLTEGVVSLAIDPNNSNIVYAGTAQAGRLWKTTDAGETWILTGLGETSQMIHDILIHPLNTEIVYAAISEIGVWKSEDHGNTWAQYNIGLLDTINAMKIVMRRKNLELFLVGTRGDNGWIYKKRNNEEPWQKFGIDDLRQSYYYSDIKFSNSENMIYFGSKGLYYFKLK